MELKIILPQGVEQVLRTLQQTGFEAFAVGGCIRDILLGKEPFDWDVTTSASPKETQQIFAAYHVIPTGIQHGTVTVLINQKSIEITTYRIDGKYTDNRHPDTVQFTKSLREDLARRDFTINALAYSPSTGLIDFFNGTQDLHDGIIRCVGEPALRFQEDSLRILRALRFSSVLNFTIEKDTSDGLIKQKSGLANVSIERITIEFIKLLCGQNVESVLREYPSVLAEIIPEVTPCIGFLQNSRYHIYDVWEHTIHAVSAIAPEPILRLSALLHDIAKPECYSEDDEGNGHFYGHQNRSSELAEQILRRLKLDNRTIATVTSLVKYHDFSITDSEKYIRRWLNKLGETNFRLLLQVNRADTLAHAQCAMDQLEILEEEEKTANRILSEKLCFNLKTLKVTGADLLRLGIPEGKEIGIVLQKLLNAVLEEKCPNDKESLLTLAQQFLKK